MAKHIVLRDLLTLTQLGIAPEHIKFKNVSLESKYITVREEGKNSVAIVELASKNVMRLPVNVDSAIMNPVSKVVALRADAQNTIQIYNLEMKTKMKATQLQEPVVFWRWLDLKTIALVSDKAVYHWSMDENSPVKKFDRAAYQGQVQILNYQASKDGKWLILGGIAASQSGVVGVLQVHSVDLNASQPPIDSHAACFASVKIDGREAPSTLFCFTKQIPNQGVRLNILEVGVPKEQAFTQSAAINFQGPDFPVSMLADDRTGMVWILTKLGYLFVFEIQSGKQIFASQISKQTFFASCLNDDLGILAADMGGRVVYLGIDKNEIVPYICNTLQDLDLGLRLAQRNDWPGAGGMFQKQFVALMQQGKHQEAMQLAIDSPQGVLRTTDTINALKNVAGGQLVLQYFQSLLKKGSLNKVESIELCRPILARNKDTGIEHIKEWLKENKLEPSEDLGDLLKNHNVTLALSVYLRAKVPEKVIGCFLTLGAQERNDQQAQEHFKNILAYAQRVSFSPDYPLLIQQLATVSPDRAKDFALMLLLDPEGPKVDIGQTADAFLRANDIKNTTNILLEYLRPRGDRPEDAALQTKLLEINLRHAPQVADAILESSDYKFSHYDRVRIAQLCEHAQLYQRALQHYRDLADIKRVLTYSHQINPEFLLEFFGQMSPDHCIDCLRDLLKFNLQQNLRLVVEVAKKWSEVLTPAALIGLFEEFKSYNGIYFYLGSFVNTSDDRELVFKYIEAATKLGQFKEVERVCREHEHYDPVKVKEFLLTQNLKDPRPLIHVCDRFGFIDELTQHLYTNNLYMFIEAYVQRMNSKATPAVLGTLLDLNANEEQIKKLLSNIRPPPDDVDFVGRLVEAVESRGRLKMVRPFLEARNQEGSEDRHVHNGLAKIYVEVNNNPQGFLTSNRFYDSRVVGKFCESRDPHLAFVAYKRAWGECDDELIEVTNTHGFFKDQASYLVERQDGALWAKVLGEDNQHRRQLIDQVVATALPNSRVPDEVSSTVKAFMAANLPNELIELLEKIILHASSNSEFHSNKSLQNLLILTAIKADKKRVMDYIKRLDNYDGPDIAKIAVSEQYQLYEEAFFIYKKFKKGPEAIQVLIDNMEDIPRATEFAEYWDTPDVWSILGKAQLDAKLVRESIISYLKANDASQFQLVLTAAKEASFFTEVIDYIKMARSKIKDPLIDNELIYCFAKTDKLSDLEDFINGSHVAKISEAGDRCFEEQLYHAARILYNHVNNYAKLAVTLVRLQLWQDAFNAAQKANAIGTWKAVCFACVDAQQFRLAQMCGLNIIVYLDQLVELIRHYEKHCFFDEVIQLLEQGVNLDRAHQGIFTQLGVLYCKYKEEKLMEHIKMFWSRLNIPTLLGACQENLHWTEAVFLYRHYDQYDQAVDTLINHSSECWTHELFKEAVKQVVNTEVYYRGIEFYIREHPTLLNDLLLDLSPQLDHSRVTLQVSRAGLIPLVQRYLSHVQHDNLTMVNEALNKLYVETEDYKQLRKSIDEFDQFDQIGLAQSLENHELLEFRRISAHLYRINKRWDKSIELSRKDSLWQDAMETTALSGDKEQAEQLLQFFVEKGEYECFAACLYTCFELIRPDLVLELAWRYDLNNLAMPYLIQCMRQFQSTVAKINEKIEAQEEEAKKIEEAQKKAEEEQQQNQAAYVGNTGAYYNPLMAPLAIEAPRPGYYGQPY